MNAVWDRTIQNLEKPKVLPPNDLAVVHGGALQLGEILECLPEEERRRERASHQHPVNPRVSPPGQANPPASPKGRAVEGIYADYEGNTFTIHAP